MDSTNNTSPAAWIAPGALPEAGAIYYWRIRSAKSATSQIADSPWSEVRSFTIKAGFIVNTPYYGVQLLSPNNGGIGVATKPDPVLLEPLERGHQVRIRPRQGFRVQADGYHRQHHHHHRLLIQRCSGLRNQLLLACKGARSQRPEHPERLVGNLQLPDRARTCTEKPAPAEPATPLWAWVIIAIGAILLIVTLILIFKTRRM